MRLYGTLIRLGYFDPASATPYRSYNFANVSTPASEALALKAAEEGIVLLKNDGILPLSLPSGGKKMNISLMGECKSPCGCLAVSLLTNLARGKRHHPATR
jgi:beta-glucosidase-like glycosyl hydrolase